MLFQQFLVFMGVSKVKNNIQYLDAFICRAVRQLFFSDIELKFWQKFLRQKPFMAVFCIFIAYLLLGILCHKSKIAVIFRLVQRDCGQMLKKSYKKNLQPISSVHYYKSYGRIPCW